MLFVICICICYIVAKQSKLKCFLEKMCLSPPAFQMFWNADQNMLTTLLFENSCQIDIHVFIEFEWMFNKAVDGWY